MQERVVITGASGHIGFHIAFQLIQLGYNVMLLIREENKNIQALKEMGANVSVVDFADPLSYQHKLASVDVLFHVASANTTNTKNEKNVIENTFTLTKKVINTAVKQKVKTIVYTSSVVVLGRSNNSHTLIDENARTTSSSTPYVKGKLLAEDFCEGLINEQRIDIRRMYPSWVVGKNNEKQTPPHTLIKTFLQRGQPCYFAGGISVAGVEEVAKAHISCWLKGKPYARYIVAGTNVTFKDFYYKLSITSGHKAPKFFCPKWLLYAASIPSKYIFGFTQPDPKHVRSIVGKYSWYTSQKAADDLGYCISDLAVLLKETVSDIKIRELGSGISRKKEDQNIKRLEYGADDVLLITGFPGVLANRMVEVLINGDRFAKNAVRRNIRLLVQPQFKGCFSLPSDIDVCYGDITDKASLTPALKDVKTVYHLAGTIYPNNINSYYKVNYEGTKNVVDTCIELGARRIVFMSSDSTCGYGRGKRIFDENTIAKPYKHYGKSKYLAEQYILNKTNEGKIDGTSLRGFWFFGPAVPERNLKFLRLFKNKYQVVFGDGKNYRSISHVDNVIQAFLKAEKNSNTIGKWYWIANKKSVYTVDEIYENLADGLGVNYNPFYIPKWTCEILNLVDTMFAAFGKINASIHAAGKFHKDIAGEITAAERDFDYTPDVDFEEIKKEVSGIIT